MDETLPQGAPVQEPGLFKRYLMSKFGMGDPVQRHEQDAYRQQLALQHFQEMERANREDSIKIADKLKPAFEELSRARTAMAAVAPFKGTPQYELAADHYATAQAYVAALQQAAGTSWQKADAIDAHIPGMIAGMRMPQQGMDQGPSAPAGKGSESYSRPSYSSPSEPRSLPPPEPAPLSQDQVMAPNEASPQQGPQEPLLQGIPARQWKQGLAEIGFPTEAADEGNRLVYTFDTEEEAKHFQGILDEMGKEAMHALPVAVRSIEKGALQAKSNQEFWFREARMAEGRAAQVVQLDLATKDDAELQALATQAAASGDEEMAANLRLIANTKKELRGPVISDIENRFKSQATEARDNLKANEGPYRAYQEWLQRTTGSPVSTYTPTPGGMTKETTDALNSYLNEQAVKLGWDGKSALSPELKAKLKPLRDAWMTAHGAAAAR